MTKEQKYRADIIIIGGGVAGLVLALLLGNKNMNVHVVEPSPPAPLSETNPSGRTVALMQSTLNILDAIGLHDFCTQHGTKMEIMRIIDDSIPGQKTITSAFDSFDLGLSYFGMNIPNSLLRAKLYGDAKKNDHITLHEEQCLHDYRVENNTVTTTLKNGVTIKTPLIIGADGRQSTVRDIAKIPTHHKKYNQTAITCIINHSRAHDNTSTEFHRPGGPFALVPMQGNQSSVVWVEHTARADELMHAPKDAFENALHAATNDILGGITLESTPQSWPLCAIKAKSLTAPRVALIAEAAHVMSPITAQGLNLSLRDVASLAETIIDARRIGSDYGNHQTLCQYERRRTVDIDTRTFGVNTLNQMVSNALPPVKDLRRGGLKILNRFPPLKLMAMQHGLAPTLDQGRLVRGEGL